MNQTATAIEHNNWTLEVRHSLKFYINNNITLRIIH